MKYLRFVFFSLALMAFQDVDAQSDNVKRAKMEYKQLFKELRRDYDSKRKGLNEGASDALERSYWQERLRIKKLKKSTLRSLKQNPSYAYQLPEVQSLEVQEVVVQLEDWSEKAEKPKTSSDKKTKPEPRAEAKARWEMTAVQSAEQALGKPYVYGGTGKRGYDCSGLTQQAYADFGVKIPRTSAEQAKFGQKVKWKDLQTGDLVFFAHKGKKVSHVGIVSKVKGRKVEMIHASSSSGVIRTDLHDSSYWKPRFVLARRPLQQ